MEDDVVAVTAGAVGLLDSAAVALEQLEPLLDPHDQRDLRELVMLMGWWAGRLAAIGEAGGDAPSGAGIA